MVIMVATGIMSIPAMDRSGATTMPKGDIREDTAIMIVTVMTTIIGTVMTTMIDAIMTTMIDAIMTTMVTAVMADAEMADRITGSAILKDPAGSAPAGHAKDPKTGRGRHPVNQAEVLAV